MKLSLVVSVYNEEAVLPFFLKNLQEALGFLNEADYEILFVNDGSLDCSETILQNFTEIYPYVKVIHFSRNFGHEAAMTAGLDYAIGDHVLCMDADLQHPPDLIQQIYKKQEEGFDIINMVREKREDSTFLHSFFSYLFYFIFNRLSHYNIEPGASDFFLVSRRVADVLREDFHERARFMRGFVQIIGFPKTTIHYKAPARKYGESKYGFRKLLTYFFHVLFSFSRFPLRLGLFLGGMTALCSIIVGIYSIIKKLFTNEPPSGYTTIVVLISFLFAIQFFLTGIIGEYIAHLFLEVKRRPIYIVKETINF
ncbi:MAG: glycosyltransferase family 2 protein [Leptospiraceae bacterium]|nr:glycosyltransferase family 2 protein [Leptospiraceae bacterium]MCP5500157.1 glycosyltransferase family 2 protein [Leptospiraceae bacterium]